MALDLMHPEDVKAALRKKYGSVSNFVRLKGLPRTSVSDIFRGRTSKRVRDAIESALADKDESIILDASKARLSAHRLNAEAA